MREKAELFGNPASLVGILTQPLETAQRTSLPAVVLLNDGLIHRVGPNRLYVKMAQAFAALGFVVLRFDFSGIGDSDVRHDHLPFEKSSVMEAQEVMSYLKTAGGTERFVLMGVCSGGLRSLQIACSDARVVGVVLINPQPYYNDTGEAVRSYLRNRGTVLYYWKIALIDPTRWWKAMTGQIQYRQVFKAIAFQLKNLLASKKIVSVVATSLAADLRLLIRRGVHLLIVFSEGNPGLEYLRVSIGDELAELSSDKRFRVAIIPKADQSFTLLWNQEQLLEVLVNWLEAMKEN